MLATAVLISAPLVLGVLAQSSSSASLMPSASMSMPSASMSSNSSSPAQTTLNIFLDSEPDQSFVGSIMDADACETTIAIACTQGDYGNGQFSFTCDGGVVAHATYRGSTEFGLSTAVETETLGHNADVKLTETCSLAPSTSAVCSVLLSASVEDADKTKTQSTVTYSGDEAAAKWFQVPITAGAEKLPPATATCSGNGNGAVATGVVDLVKVVVVPGAAALLAAGAAF